RLRRLHHILVQDLAAQPPQRARLPYPPRECVPVRALPHAQVHHPPHPRTRPPPRRLAVLLHLAPPVRVAAPHPASSTPKSCNLRAPSGPSSNLANRGSCKVQRLLLPCARPPTGVPPVLSPRGIGPIHAPCTRCAYCAGSSSAVSPSPQSSSPAR